MAIYRMYLRLMKNQIFAVIVYGLIYVALIVLLANVSTDELFTGYEQEKVTVTLVDEDAGSDLAEGLKAYLSDYCDYEEIHQEMEEERDALFYNAVNCIVTIPYGFSERFGEEDQKNVIVESTGFTSEAEYVKQVIAAYLTDVKLLYNNGLTLQEAIQVQTATQESNPTVVLSDTTDTQLMKQLSNTNLVFNLLVFCMTACFLLITGNAMSQIREEKMYERHMVAPVSKIALFSQVLLGNLSYGVIYTAVFIGIGIVFGGKLISPEQLLLYGMNTVFFAGTILLLGNLLGLILRNRTRINVSANLIGLVLACISGVFIRQEYLNQSVLKIASLFPAYWFVFGNRIIMGMTQVTWSQMKTLLIACIIQGMFMLVFLLAGLVMMKVYSEKD